MQIYAYLSSVGVSGPGPFYGHVWGRMCWGRLGWGASLARPYDRPVGVAILNYDEARMPGLCVCRGSTFRRTYVTLWLRVGPGTHLVRSNVVEILWFLVAWAHGSIGSLAHWLIGSVTHRVIGSLAQ